MVANVAEFKEASEEIAELKRVFDLQKKAAAADPYPTIEWRKAQLKKLSQATMAYKTQLREALEADFGARGVFESVGAEIMSIPQACMHQSRHIKKWMKPERRAGGPMGMLGKARISYQPLGVVGIIVPWNYPVNLAGMPLVGALGAGNRAILKMSEFTPQTGLVFKEMIESVFSEDEVAVINGEADVAVEFTKLAWDHLLFTGSTSIGKHVMRAAAENLVPVTLELGGKSPAIISDSVPISDAVERITNGKLMNAGQTCVAPDYVLCPESKLEEFVDTMTKTATRMYPNIVSNKSYTNIINERQHDRLCEHIKDAEAKGAKVIAINPAKEEFKDTKKFPLHLVLNTNEDMTVVQEELFGPVLPIIPYKSLDEAIKYVNDRPRPLALYYFDYNKGKQNYVVEKTHSGGVCMNDTIVHLAVEDAPFGGIGPSGMGHYHGPEGFKTFSHARTVLVRGKFNALKYMYPPHDKGIAKIAMDFLRK